MSIQASPRFQALRKSLARLSWPTLAPLMAVLIVAILPTPAMADFSIPFIDTFGCDVIKWMKGPLAILIFLVVVVATFVIGMMAKMDWSRIVSVCVVFGIIIGLGGIFANSNWLQGSTTLAGCLN